MSNCPGVSPLLIYNTQKLQKKKIKNTKKNNFKKILKNKTKKTRTHGDQGSVTMTHQHYVNFKIRMIIGAYIYIQYIHTHMILNGKGSSFNWLWPTWVQCCFLSFIKWQSIIAVCLNLFLCMKVVKYMENKFFKKEWLFSLCLQDPIHLLLGWI